MKKLRVFILAIMACVISNFTILHAQAATINKGIFIGGLDVSGLSAEGAKQEVMETVDSWSRSAITLKSPSGYEVVVHPADLGIFWTNSDVTTTAASYGYAGNVIQRYKAAKDLENENINYNIELSFDKEKIDELIVANLDNFNQEAINCGLEKTESGIKVIPGVPGVKIDSDATDKFYSFLVNNWDGGEAVYELPSTVDNPLGSNGELAELKDVIGTFTTSFKSSGAARTQNVSNGCRLIDGAILYPGEQLSVLSRLLPFSEENGYEKAGSYSQGLVVESFGGGICQVSTTLYNAVLLAELQVDERSNHSMIVDYVPPSGDAAIAESSGKDFKFTNNRDFPIYIEGIIADKTITFNIYGIEDRPANRVVTYESETLERTVADYESIVPDASKPIGYTSQTSSHAGIKAQYIKKVTVDGVEVSSEVINKSTYKMVPRTLVVGVGTDNIDAYNQLQEAIATGSISNVKAVAANLAAQSAARQQEAVTAGDP